MRRHTLAALLLIPLAAGLYLLPASGLMQWRLAIYSAFVRAVRPASGEAPLPRYAGAENSDRAALIHMLHQKDAKIAALRVRLGHMSEAREQLPALTFVSATTISMPRGASGYDIVIDRGRADGLEEGDALVQGQSFAGVITEVGSDSSMVRLASSPMCMISASVTPSRDEPGRAPPREICSVTGRGRTMAEAVFYGRSVNSRKGDMVLTSELNESIPKDLIVGVLAEDPEEGAEPNTLVAPVRLEFREINMADFLVIKRTVH